MNGLDKLRKMAELINTESGGHLWLREAHGFMEAIESPESHFRLKILSTPDVSAGLVTLSIGATCPGADYLLDVRGMDEHCRQAVRIRNLIQSLEKLDLVCTGNELRSFVNELAGEQVYESDSPGWIVATATGSTFYIDDALHVERDDNLEENPYASDTEAAKAAAASGICLIEGMDGVPDGVYIDTEDNRKLIAERLVEYPKYRYDEELGDTVYGIEDNETLQAVLAAQAAEEEPGMDKDEFVHKIEQLLQNVAPKCFENWDTYVHNMGDDNPLHRVEPLYRELYTAIEEVHKDFGSAIASEVFQLPTTTGYSLNSFEMYGAASMLKDGIPALEVGQRAQAGQCSRGPVMHESESAAGLQLE